MDATKDTGGKGKGRMGVGEIMEEELEAMGRFFSGPEAQKLPRAWNCEGPFRTAPATDRAAVTSPGARDEDTGENGNGRRRLGPFMETDGAGCFFFTGHGAQQVFRYPIRVEGPLRRTAINAEYGRAAGASSGARDVEVQEIQAIAQAAQDDEVAGASSRREFIFQHGVKWEPWLCYPSFRKGALEAGRDIVFRGVAEYGYIQVSAAYADYEVDRLLWDKFCSKSGEFPFEFMKGPAGGKGRDWRDVKGDVRPSKEYEQWRGAKGL